MWALRIVVLAPALDHDPRLGQAVEDLAIEQLVSQLRVEALAIAILPWTAGLDVSRTGADSGDPLPHGLGDELWPIVRPDMVWHASQDELVRQNVDHISGPKPAIDPDRQALAGELVDQVEHAEPPSVMCPALDEVVGPDMVGPLRPQTDA